MEDIHNRMLDWGTEGTINPFNEIYNVSILDVFGIGI